MSSLGGVGGLGGQVGDGDDQVGVLVVDGGREEVVVLEGDVGETGARAVVVTSVGGGSDGTSSRLSGGNTSGDSDGWCGGGGSRHGVGAGA